MECFHFVSNLKNSSVHAGQHDLKKTVSKVVKVLLPLGVSAGLVVWLFHKVNIHQIGEIISRGVAWQYIIVMMLLTVLSHIIRGVRWGMQLRAAGVPRMSWLDESVSIFGAYALNLVFPFIGEAWRCVYVSRSEKVKLATVVGTDLGDRGSDFVMIILLLILTLFVARPEMMRFMDKYALGRSIEGFSSSAWTWIIIIGVIVTSAVLYHVFRHTEFIQGVRRSILRMWNGFSVLFHMKGIGLYIVLTFGIWICYYLQAYVCFYAFPFTRALVTAPGAHWGILMGLVVFVFGSVSMGVPSNGGLGPWNIAVMFALSLFGLSEADGAAYSIVVWSFQTIVLIASGIFSAFYIMWRRKHVKISASTNPQP